MKKEDANIQQYVTGKTLDGLYFMISEEEKKIRQNPVALRQQHLDQSVRRVEMTGWSASSVCAWGGLLTLAALQACTPALNWRQVQLQDLKARLPCKADTATRPVPLAATPLDLQMMGCEADGALFAISYVRAQDTEAATRVVQPMGEHLHCRRCARRASQPASWQAPAWATQAVSLRADGQNPKGEPVASPPDMDTPWHKMSITSRCMQRR